MRASGGEWVGRSLLRREDGPLLRGRGRFVDDLPFDDQVHLLVVRSVVAHARLGPIDLGPARAMPGVLAVVAAADLGDTLGPLPLPLIEGAELAPVPVWPLATGRVRYVGEPVVAIVAETRGQAEDAAELVAPEYEPLPVVTDPGAALGAEPPLHEAAPGNRLLHWRRSGGEVAAAFESAAHVVRGRFVIPRLAAAPMEPRGCVAAYDPAHETLTLWPSAQDPHRPLAHLTAALGWPADRVRVIVPDVGGAFGSKGALAPEHALAAWCAWRLGRPVKWVEDRSENFQAAYQGRGMAVEAELALSTDGRFRGLRARLVADLGAYLYPTTPVPPITAANLFTGPYAVPAAEVEIVGVATNKVPTGPYRGAGRPEAAFCVERLVDLAAAQLGEDPVELRRRNLIPPDQFPHRTPLGLTYDSGDYGALLDRACELLPYSAWRAEQARARAAGAVLGVGVACFVESAGHGLWERARVAVTPTGAVEVQTGASPHGQGHATTFAQVVADTLGVVPDRVVVRQGDSADGPGVGTFASRSVAVGGSAIRLAAEEVRATARRLAAHLFEAAEEDLVWDQDRLAVVGSPGQSVSLGELAQVAADPARRPAHVAGLEDGLAAVTRFSLPGPVFPSGAYAAVVAVDRDTGVVRLRRLVAVDDSGAVVNPLLAEGQVVGAIVQGAAAVLLEEVVYDEEGQLRTGTFLDYAIPTIGEVDFELVTEFHPTPSPFNPLGAKGVGECGTIGAPAAIANAVVDALAPFGVRHLDPPYHSERVWRAMRRDDASRPPGEG